MNGGHTHNHTTGWCPAKSFFLFCYFSFFSFFPMADSLYTTWRLTSSFLYCTVRDAHHSSSSRERDFAAETITCLMRLCLVHTERAAAGRRALAWGVYTAWQWQPQRDCQREREVANRRESALLASLLWEKNKTTDDDDDENSFALHGRHEQHFSCFFFFSLFLFTRRRFR